MNIQDKGHLAQVFFDGGIGIGLGTALVNGQRAVALNLQGLEDRMEPGEIYDAKTVRMVGMRLELYFTNPKSIDSVIGQLERLKKELLKSEQPHKRSEGEG